MAKTANAAKTPGYKILSINDRLTHQIEILLDQMETGELDITFPQRLNALIAIGRIQVMFATLKKVAHYYEQSDTGGAKIREYSSAFDKTAAGARRREAVPRSADILELGDFGGADDDSDGED